MGLGRLHALALAELGASVIVNDVGTTLEGAGEDKSKAQEVVDEIVAAGGQAATHHGDVSDWSTAEGMIQHATHFSESGVPFIFDPGQGMPLFDGDDLMRFVEQANWVTLNDYEAQLMQDRTGLARLAFTRLPEAVFRFGADKADMWAGVSPALQS